MIIKLNDDNSIEIPEELIKTLNLRTNQELKINLGNNCIIIEPVSQSEKIEEALRKMSEKGESDPELIMAMIEGMDI